jgi:hypothetical protein
MDVGFDSTFGMSGQIGPDGTIRGWIEVMKTASAQDGTVYMWVHTSKQALDGCFWVMHNARRKADIHLCVQVDTLNMNTKLKFKSQTPSLFPFLKRMHLLTSRNPFPLSFLPRSRENVSSLNSRLAFPTSLHWQRLTTT